MATAKRGSEKVFDQLAAATDERALGAMLANARGNYEVKWWWKYGKPAIDVIRGTLHVKPDQIGNVIQDLVGMNNPNLHVTCDVFPFGVVETDLLQVNVQLARQMKGK